MTGPQAGMVADRLDRERPGAFDVRTRPDEAAARAALQDREAYGAIVATPSGPKVLTASAASPAIAQQLGAVAARLGGGAASSPAEDVVAADSDDPRGAGFGALALPLVMSGIAAAVLLTFAIPSAGWRAAGAVLFAALGGLGVAGVAQGWLSLLPGSYLAVAGVMSLTVLAVTGAIARPRRGDRARRDRCRSAHHAAPRQPPVGGRVGAGDAAAALGRARPVPASGGVGHAAEVDGVLRRRGRRRGARRPGGMGRRRSGALRARRDARTYRRRARREPRTCSGLTFPWRSLTFSCPTTCPLDSIP
ncbi:hypothetical protein [Actinomadura madurae]|uniref:hypothetical protein n=1 Tax=Actinomadura madurae TaxID=1993 RepID=UPI0020D21FDF|nr:hypothetical protein [Actinomadura madurae]MCQ0004624.1 hypothetical protein [Actinomadura madurae]MCQ0020047.1 hypothetical protein [Actinomadura madurae]